ncbi:hypothetical protein LAZ67_1002284 [Cordylochernes scorpioides]|uniref:GIY-YIG domain-containing protein n=1 Tax=Cordylochernes scorpioides TaxID=51811 RepID=A0ABY6JXK6_9ARAC|nr:hypothetical protein LAZ67_1002284 [Cordylochernes scorpioides]
MFTSLLGLFCGKSGPTFRPHPKRSSRKAKCSEKARDRVWWPGIGPEILGMIRQNYFQEKEFELRIFERREVLSRRLHHPAHTSGNSVGTYNAGFFQMTVNGWVSSVKGMARRCNVLENKGTVSRLVMLRVCSDILMPIFKTIEKNRIISHLTISGFPLSFIEKHTYSPVPLNPPATYKSTCVIPFSPLSVNLSRFLKPFGIHTFFTNTPNLHSLLRHPITKTDSSTDPLTSSGAVYSVSCQQCSATYVGETGRTIAIRMSEHTRNITNRDTRSLIFQHIASSGHSFDTANPTIHYKNISNLHQRLVLESIVSSKLHSINRKIDIPAAYTNYI